MILWAIVVGGLFGWCAAGFEQWGAMLGAAVGLGAGWWLRAAVRAEIAHTQGALIAQIRAERGTQAAPATIAPGIADSPVLPIDEPEDARATIEAAPARVEIPAWSNAPPVAPQVPSGPSAPERALAAARAWLLGGNTIVRAGLVILFVGLSFLARYAAAAGLFPVELRLALVVLVGIALLVVGFRTRTRKREFALALQGGGVAVIYLTVFAATHFFDVVAVAPAFGVMMIVCALSCALALLQNAQSLAVAAFVGGFAVPLLLANGNGSAVTLFGYYTVLNLAVLVFAKLRSWRIVTLVGFFGTFGVATLWGLTSYGPADFMTAQLFLITSVLIYVAAAVLYAHNTPGALGNVVDTTLLFGPALAGFGLEVGLVRPIPFGSAFAALGFAALYLAVASLLIRRGRAEFRLFNETALAIGVGFVTLAVPLALGARWTSSAWALEGAGAFWVGMRQARWMPRLFGLLLQFVAAALFVGSIGGNIAALPLIDPAFIGATLIAVAGVATAWWLRRPLAQSGSYWALGYARGEAALAQPAFLFGFAFWWLALALEIVRLRPLADGALLPVIDRAIQPLLAMLAFVASAAVAAACGRRWRWPVALWPARATLAPILFVALTQGAQAQHILYTPNWAIWAVTLALHYGLLFRDETTAPPQAELSLLHRVVHVGGAWLLVAMVADCLWLAIDRGDLWTTSWAGVVFLVSAIAVLLFLTLWAGKAGPGDRRSARWPLRAHADDYGVIAALPIAGLTFVGTFAAALLAAGVTAPLPYLPLLNPVDLTLLLAIAALLLWRNAMRAPARWITVWLHARHALAALAILGFVVINTIWLRFAHHMLGVGWDAAALLDSFVVQMGLAILWTLLALGLMLVAHRRTNRMLWITGAGLLALVVVKLLLVDLTNEEGAVRIVTFMVVGGLMLVVGYFVPLPPKSAIGSPAESAT